MKKEENINLNNFTKLTRGGISLIVLVITIIIIIILASAIIVSTSTNNSISDANKARFENDIDSVQAVFTNVLAKVITNNKGTVIVKAGKINEITSGVTETIGSVNYIVKNAENKEKESGTIYFDKGTSDETTFYTGKQLPIYAAGDTQWYVDEEGRLSLEIAGTKYGDGEKPPINAKSVLEDVTTYYGEKVTNYTTGNDEIDSQVEWQIFYADEKNIYLISTDYVHYNLLPKTKVIEEDGTVTEYALNSNGDYKAYWNDDILAAYTGSENITDTRLQTLNSDYFAKKYTSEYNNMKAVAYMMDIDIWDTFAGGYADYAIGGPTVEMLMKSYSQKYSASNVDYRAKATSKTGYQISKDGGDNWANFYSGILSISDTQYVINYDDKKADGMWLASPSDYDVNGVMHARCNGNVYYYGYGSSSLGFRPIVCLNSNISLKPVDDGYAIE